MLQTLKFYSNNKMSPGLEGEKKKPQGPYVKCKWEYGTQLERAYPKHGGSKMPCAELLAAHFQGITGIILERIQSSQKSILE